MRLNRQCIGGMASFTLHNGVESDTRVREQRKQIRFGFKRKDNAAFACANGEFIG